MTVLELDGVTIRYGAGEDAVHAVEDVSFSVGPGETFGLVGESGSGKTTIARGIPRLLDPGGSIEAGSIWLDAVPRRWSDGAGAPRQEVVEDDRYPVRSDGMVDLVRLDDGDLRDLRWRRVSLVPQSAMNALNPVYPVDDQVVEAIQVHEPGTTAAAARDRAHRLLERVGVTRDRAGDYAHEFSGGMRQRAVIAMAVACNPRVVVADEPTTGLDVITQDRVLDALAALAAEFEVALLVISHDVSVMAEICDRLGVMYGGRLMEVGPVESVLETPGNPYTMGLRNAVPDPDTPRDRLVAIPGTPPTLTDPADECRFVDRCPFAEPTCRTGHPPLFDVASPATDRRHRSARGHRSACYRADEAEALRDRAADEETWGGPGRP